jgi:hypothetical protein
MSERFEPMAPSVLVPVTITGPSLTFTFKFALDTGSTGTSLRIEYLRRLGYRPESATRHRRIRSATGVAMSPVLDVLGIAALGHVRTRFPVAAHDHTLGTSGDGLLGLDFFRGSVLTLDFARGRASLGPPRKWWQVWR